MLCGQRDLLPVDPLESQRDRRASIKKINRRISRFNLASDKKLMYFRASNLEFLQNSPLANKYILVPSDFRIAIVYRNFCSIRKKDFCWIKAKSGMYPPVEQTITTNYRGLFIMSQTAKNEQLNHKT